MASDRDNFKAGLFVIIGVMLGLVLIFLLADIQQLLEKQQQVRVYYALGDGIKGLKAGAQITLGDQPVGTVLEIQDAVEADHVVGKRVIVEMPDRIKLYEDAAIELVVPPLGSGTRLNIRSVGAGSPYNASQDIAGQLASSELTKSLAKHAGIAEKQRQQIKQVIANAAAITETLKNDLPQITATIQQVLDKAGPVVDEVQVAVNNMKQATEDVKQITGNYRTRSAGWADRVDRITGNIDQATGTVNQLVKDKRETIGQTVDDLGAAAGNVKAVTVRAKGETMDQITVALNKADAALENVRHATDQLKTLAVGQRPVLERAIANAQITTGQLKLTAIEVRRSPWRLLYKPDDKELATDNLYDAARSFALAAGALDSAAQSLRAVSTQEGVATDTITQMVSQLEKLFGKFAEAEQSFWQALKPHGPLPASATGQ